MSKQDKRQERKRRGNPIEAHADDIRKKVFRVALRSYPLVLVSLGLNGLAVMLNEAVFMFLGGIAAIVAWWMAVSSAQGLNRMLSKTDN